MTAKILPFKRPGHSEQLDHAIRDVQTAYVGLMGRKLPDHLARKIAEAIESAPAKVR